MKKSTLDHLITFAMVIVAYLIVQILIAAGVLSSLMQGLLVPMCTYSIVAIGLNLCVGYLGELSIGHAGFMCVGAFSRCYYIIRTHTYCQAVEYSRQNTSGKSEGKQTNVRQYIAKQTGDHII